MPVAKQTTISNVVCPFCSLLCDDLSVTPKKDRLVVEGGGCLLSRRGIEYTGTALSAHVAGEPVAYADALSRAVQILKKARQPLIGGMGADVKGCQAALALAEKCGAAVDHMHSDGIMGNLSVLQGRGWMQTTLTELRNRSDLVVFVGTDAVSANPRFFDRCVWPRDALLKSRLKNRQVVYLGDALDTRPGVNPDGRKPRVLQCGRHELAETLGAVRALLRGREPAAGNVLTRKRLTELRELVKRLQAARYGVFIWSAGELDATSREPVIQSICELVITLNETTRFAGLALGGADGGISSNNVSAWQTGFPGRVNFAGGAPHYDPELYRGETMLQSGMADALLWISSFDPNAKLPAAKVPTIALTRPSRRVASAADVYFPVGAPGVDHDGSLFRMDGVVSLPLRKLRNALAPSVSDVLTQLRERL